MIQAKTKEQKEYVIKLIGLPEVCCNFPLDFENELYCGIYEEYNDRIYLDGNITFDKMKQIVDYLENSKQSV